MDISQPEKLPSPASSVKIRICEKDMWTAYCSLVYVKKKWSLRTTRYISVTFRSAADMDATELNCYGSLNTRAYILN